jgi:hypothetical protein
MSRFIWIFFLRLAAIGTTFQLYHGSKLYLLGEGQKKTEYVKKAQSFVH